MKKCKRCKTEKPLTDFGKHSDYKDGLMVKCRKCRAEVQKIYRENNPEKIRLQNKKYNEKNKDKIKLQRHKRYKKNEDRIKLQSHKYYEKNKDKTKLQNKKYYLENKNKILKTQQKYKKHKYRTDIIHRLKSNLRSRFSSALKNNQKNGSAVRDLGCNIIFLKWHLEAQFQPGMTWDNYGEWHIDHIKPLALFDLTDRKQLLEACHYSNLQPMWAEENMSKGAKY